MWKTMRKSPPNRNVNLQQRLTTKRAAKSPFFWACEKTKQASHPEIEL
ncbi:hypothetical protein QWZ13_16930 [Reinekea marina]|nr:hypothetical protein [Reinekea marina]MDN3650591.1 hypothetical protein [Reinekea marina]